MPWETASPSKARMSEDDADATSSVHGFTIACPGGVSSKAKRATRYTTKRMVKRLTGTSPRVRGDERLHRVRIGLHHGEPLRQVLDSLEPFRAWRVLPEGLDDAFVEL